MNTHFEKWNNIIVLTQSIFWSVDMVIRRGDIYYADLRPVIGSEQGGIFRMIQEINTVRLLLLQQLRQR